MKLSKRVGLRARKGFWWENFLTWPRAGIRMVIEAWLENAWDFFMSIRAERTRSILLIFVAFLLAVSPAYFLHNDLVEIDFLSPHPGFENPDQGNLPADKPDRTMLFVHGFSSFFSVSSFFSIEQLPCLSFQIFSVDQRISVLRC